MRSLGYPISMEEEAFRKKLENLYMELNKPTQFKGRLNELTSLVRMQVIYPSSSFFAFLFFGLNAALTDKNRMRSHRQTMSL